MLSLLKRPILCKNNNLLHINKVYNFISHCTGNENIGQIYSKKVSRKKQNSLKNATQPPQEPTTCCMSGCANCVWLDYAEKLCLFYQDGEKRAIEDINEKISDPNIKAYILHEIRMRNKR